MTSAFMRGCLGVFRKESYQFLTRLKVRAIGLFANPLFNLAVFGVVLGGRVSIGVDYLGFVSVGLIALTAINGSLGLTAFNVVRQHLAYRYLDSVLVSPVSPAGIVAGHALAGTLRGAIGAGIFWLVITAFGVSLSLAQDSLMVISIILGSLFFSCMGIFLGIYVTRMTDMFSLSTPIQTAFIFFSGIFFPISLLPSYLSAPSFFLPLTLAVSIARSTSLTLMVGFEIVLLVIEVVAMFFVSLQIFRIRLRL